MTTESPPSPFPSEGRGPGRAVDATELVRVLDGFAATVTTDFTVADILQQLAEGATRVLQVEGAGVSHVAPDGRLLRLVFATRGAAETLELTQETLQEGPCHDALESGGVINLADLAAEGAWPRYQAAAADIGIGAVTALPLRARGRYWGVLDLYRGEKLALSTEELAAASTLANLATSYLVVADDRDAARRAQEALTARATRDTLTGLPVRWVFLERLEQALARLRGTKTRLAVLFIDLDGLKYVNDTYGHAAGDQLLLHAAARIRGALRSHDVVARIGGDEFVVLLEERSDQPLDPSAVAERIVARLGMPYISGGNAVRPSASIGVAVTDDASTPAATLVAHADSAMYQAKRSRRGGVRTFDPVGYARDRAAAAAREGRVRELVEALRTDALEVHFQPILELLEPDDESDDPDRTDVAGADQVRVHAVEALVRWRHPEQGLLTAGSFIDAAEHGGLLPEIGDVVMREACRCFAGWRQEGDAPERLFVNLAPAELVAPGVVERTRAALEDSGTDPQRLTIEVTETGVMRAAGAAAHTLDALRAAGCQVAIDDFGSGHASLSRLIDVPAGTIKVDRSFTAALVSDPSARAVVAAVQALAHSLGRSVVAEGIEDDATLQAVRGLGIRHVQGYHLGRPMDAAALGRYLAAPVAGLG